MNSGPGPKGGGEVVTGLVVAEADEVDAALGGGAAGHGLLYAGDPGGEPGRAPPVAAGAQLRDCLRRSLDQEAP